MKRAMEVITRANWDAIKEAKPSMCEALKELMAEEFQELEEQVTERITEQVTEQVTMQLVRNLYENIGDATKVAEMLKLPVETVQKLIP